ncbi:MAG: hypothetical protein ACE15B_02505 [Bryobacteraceae bacterium]
MKIPVNVIFSPAWWRRRYGISFQEPFYLDVETRIRNDVLMRRGLFETFGIGEPDPRPRPVIGSRHIAGGFVMAALFDVPVRFSDDQAAWALPRNLDRASILALRAPEIETAWPMNVLIGQMDALEARFGYVTGDLDIAGILNTAQEIRGNGLFMDLLEDEELTEHLFSIVAETQVRVARCLRRRTGTTSISVNRSILDVDPRIHLASNCSVSMISPELYGRRILRHEMYAARELAPYGIHHCGNNLQKYARQYGSMDLRFLDVGAGSDVAACGRLYPNAFLNLRLSPVHLLQNSENDVYTETLELLRACGRRENVGVCCINMDAATPDANVKAMFAAARDYSGN